MVRDAMRPLTSKTCSSAAAQFPQPSDQSKAPIARPRNRTRPMGIMGLPTPGVFSGGHQSASRATPDPLPGLFDGEEQAASSRKQCSPAET